MDVYRRLSQLGRTHRGGAERLSQSTLDGILEARFEIEHKKLEELIRPTIVQSTLLNANDLWKIDLAAEKTQENDRKLVKMLAKFAVRDGSEDKKKDAAKVIYDTSCKLSEKSYFGNRILPLWHLRTWPVLDEILSAYMDKEGPQVEFPRYELVDKYLKEVYGLRYDVYEDEGHASVAEFNLRWHRPQAFDVPSIEAGQKVSVLYTRVIAQTMKKLYECDSDYRLRLDGVAWLKDPRIVTSAVAQAYILFHALLMKQYGVVYQEGKKK